MSFRALILWGLLAAPAAAKPPEPLELLRQSLSPPRRAFEAEAAVKGFGAPGQKAEARLLKLRFSPRAFYRREVFDASGAVLRVIVSDGKVEWVHDPRRGRVWRGEPADPFYKRLGPDEELERLAENYDLAAGEAEPVAGRPAWILELRSRGEGPSRRFWVDRETFLILASETLGPGGIAVSGMRFERLAYGPQDRAHFRFSPPRGATVIRRLEPDYLALEEAKAASGLEARVPAWLPAGFVFESLDVLPKGRRRVIHYRFSDGMAVLSLFQGPARVRLDFGGASRRKVRLRQARALRASTEKGNVLGWTSRGSRFVLVGPLPDETLKRVAESIP